MRQLDPPAAKIEASGDCDVAGRQGQLVGVHAKVSRNTSSVRSQQPFPHRLVCERLQFRETCQPEAVVVVPVRDAGRCNRRLSDRTSRGA
jgi:hypothetical protein